MSATMDCPQSDKTTDDSIWRRIGLVMSERFAHRAVEAETHPRGSGQGAVPSFLKKLLALRVVIPLLLVGFFCGWLLTTYVVRQVYPAPIRLSPAYSLILNYPKYIAVGDQGYIGVTICNEADKSISRSVVVEFSDHHAVCMSCSEKSNIEFQGLAPRVRQTWRIGFTLNEAPALYIEAPPSVHVRVKVVDNHGHTVDAFPDGTIEVAPFPYLRTILLSPQCLSGEFLGGVLAVVAALLQITEEAK